MKAIRYNNELPYYDPKNTDVHDAYLKEEERLYELFKKEVSEELGFSDSPNKELIFETALSMTKCRDYEKQYWFIKLILGMLSKLVKE